jgi:hypothetical protein
LGVAIGEVMSQVPPSRAPGGDADAARQGGLAEPASFDLQPPLPVGAEPLGVAIADLNGDDVVDIVTANRKSSDVSVGLQ